MLMSAAFLVSALAQFGLGLLVAALLGPSEFGLYALGFAAAAIAGHLGAGSVLQILAAAVVGGGAVVAWHLKRDRSRTELPAQANANVNLDIGGTVQVGAWNPDGTASVQYRGANWTVVHRAGVSPVTGSHRVAEVVGNRLLVDKV